MHIRPAAGLRSARASRAAVADAFVVGACAAFLAVALFAGGCAAPGEPYERKAPVPTAISNLTAEQRGDSVVLTFNLPKQSVERRPLKEPPEVEIYRAFAPPPGATGAVGAPGSAGAAVIKPPSPRPTPVLCGTIPVTDLDKYGDRGFVRYADALRPEDLAHRSGWIAEYTVRTRTSDRKESADSNFVDLVIFPAPEPIADLAAQVTQSGVALSWSEPEKTTVGAVPPIASYRIYRADRTPPSAASASAHAAPAPAPPFLPRAAGARPSGPPQEAPLVKVGESQGPAFRDGQAEFGRNYVYSVRSVAEYPGEMLESADSNLAEVTPKDIFPPAAPEGLVIAMVPREGDTPATLDLSWAISPETDIAGYRVYRGEQEGVLGTRQNEQLLLTPAFRDMNALPGHRYFYSVTAVDRAGNESPPSAILSGKVPAEN
jgi:hypothetical protein